MDIHVQITHEGKKISLSDALNNGYVQIVNNKLEAQDNTIISLSSKLFDCHGNELFENDIVKTIEGEKYKIVYDIGMFYLLKLRNNKITPLYVYKMGKSIDVEKIII